MSTRRQALQQKMASDVALAATGHRRHIVRVRYRQLGPASYVVNRPATGSEFCTLLYKRTRARRDDQVEENLGHPRRHRFTACARVSGCPRLAEHSGDAMWRFSTSDHACHVGVGAEADTTHFHVDCVAHRHYQDQR